LMLFFPSFAFALVPSDVNKAGYGPILNDIQLGIERGSFGEDVR
jgi:hypothetical protein